MTEGKLSASFKGTPQQEFFETTKVQFLGSKEDRDFLLQGEDDEGRSIVFYFPDARILAGSYSLAPEGDISAYYVVRGSLTWETLEGSLEIMPDMVKEEVRIGFRFSAKEGGSETGMIMVTGKGDFSGRMPWTLKARNLLKDCRKTKA
jgi:hypothetical protein